MSGVFMDGGSQVFMDGGSQPFMDGGSQPFMDGGHDGGHHGHFQHGDGGGDGGVYVDAPQHLHGGHAVQAGQGGDGFLANLLGLDSNHHHGFLAHLLGLDHDGGGHHAHSPATHAAAAHSPSQSAIWSSALQGMKLSHFVQGINFSANFGLLMMFMGFILWLFVVYFIRHNEPLANQVVGTVPMGDSVATDRRLVNRINTAMPVTLNLGTVNEPLPPEQPAQQVDQTPMAAAPMPASPDAVPTAQPTPEQLFGVPIGGASQTPDSSGLPASNAATTQSYSFTPLAQAQASVAPAVPSSNNSVITAPMPLIQPMQTRLPGQRSLLSTGFGQRYAVSAEPTTHGTKLKFIVNE